MAVSVQVRALVRQRAEFACEYCAVSETDSGATLTVDHYLPQSVGGSDAPDNLVYCCGRCNEYKADYTPEPHETPLYNPRTMLWDVHFEEHPADYIAGKTPIGMITIERLRLNRTPLVAHRRRLREQRLLEQAYAAQRAELTALVAAHTRLQAALEERNRLLTEQRELLQHFLDKPD